MHLMLTSRCNQSCSYCFASDAMRSLGGRLEMTVNEAKAAIDMACASSDKPAAKARISLLGGEPTLHPHFEKVLDYALRCGMHVSVFSNLLFQREIDGLLAQDVSIIANVNALTTYSKTARACLERNLRRYSESVSLSYNIHSFEPSYRNVLSLLQDCRVVRRHVRIGVASPSPSRDNAFVAQLEFPRLASFVTEMASYAAERGWTLGFDCGFVRCMFTEEQLDTLGQLSAKVQFLCATPLDVGPGLVSFNCFPLSSFRTEVLSEFESEHAIRSAFKSYFDPYRTFGITGRCFECRHFVDGVCRGGCLGQVMATLRGTSFRSGGSPGELRATGHAQDDDGQRERRNELDSRGE